MGNADNYSDGPKPAFKWSKNAIYYLHRLNIIDSAFFDSCYLI